MKHVLSPKGWAVFVVNEVEPDPKAWGWLAAGLMPSPVLVPPGWPTLLGSARRRR